MRRREGFVVLIVALVPIIVSYAYPHGLQTYSDLAALATVCGINFYIGCLVILDYDFVLVKDPRGAPGFLRSHSVARWFFRGLATVILALFFIGLFLGDEPLIIGSVSLGGAEFLVFLLLRYSSYAGKVRRDSGVRTPSRELSRILRSMALCLPLVSIMLVGVVSLLLVALLLLEPMQALFPLLLFFESGGRITALSVLVGSILYASLIEYPFWQGRGQWKKGQSRKLDRERTILLSRMERVAAPRSSAQTTVDQLLEKVDLELELARNGRSIIELRKVPSHPFGIPATLISLLVQSVFYFAFASLWELFLNLLSL